ncbi:hypothetical protein [Candidatus Palauibacter sp.]
MTKPTKNDEPSSNPRYLGRTPEEVAKVIMTPRPAKDNGKPLQRAPPTTK